MNLLWRALFVCICLYSNSNCIAQRNDFDFFIKRIESDYPGFKEKTSHNKFKDFASRTLKLNVDDTFKAMSIIANSFNDRHLQIFQVRESIEFDTNVCKKNFLDVTKYLSGGAKKRQYEGFWLNDYNDCVIGMKLVNISPLTYKAYVIESRDSLLTKGRVIGTYELIKGRTFLTDVISTYSKKRYFVNTIFRNDSIFTTGTEGKWKKLDSYDKPILNNLPQFDYSPTSKVLGNDIYLIKIPNSTQKDGQVIDSIVKADYSKISKAKTLIIDLTNNVGGKSSIYSALWPFIYTKPIRVHQTYTYSTRDNIEQVELAINEYRKRSSRDSAVLNQMNDWVKYLKDNLGKFILNDAQVIKFDSVYSRPKNVGIIINYACQSATELMLFMAKQSSKVKLFGEHTIGAADYLDFSPTYLPSKKYSLYIATTKRVITKNAPKIDGIGIYPDIPISDKVQNWQEYVKEYYEKH